MIRPDTLSLPAFLELLASGTVLEQSGSLGAKVIALPDERYLKVLRVKGRFSTWGLINPAKRFARNAQRLQQLGIATLTVEQLHRIPHLSCWGVTYRGLEGRSVRQLMAEGQWNQALSQRLAAFILQLHDRGVYFRGLHPGNILLLPSGDFGLIDVLDCAFGPRLLNFQRRRNFRHFFRYPDGQQLQDELLDAYQRLRQNP